MKTIAKKKPASEAILGGIFIVVAVYILLASLWVFVVYNPITQPTGGAIPSPDAPWGWKVIMALYHHTNIFYAALLLFAVFLIVVSIYFIKLQKWARTVLEIVCWCGLALVIFGFVAVWSSITPTASYGSGYRDFIRTEFLGTFGMIIIALFALPIYIFIRVLRSKSVKEAVT